MRKYINLDERISLKLNEYCDLNKIKLQDYLCECISKQFYIDIYGDMNKLINNKNIGDNNHEKVDIDKNIVADIKEIIINKNLKQVNLIDFANKKYDFDFNSVKIIEDKPNQNEEHGIMQKNETSQKPLINKRQLKTK